MVTYKYVGRRADGTTEEGMIEAFDEVEAAAKIREQFSAVLSMKEVHIAESSGLMKLLGSNIGGSKLDSKAFTLMCNQFATILSAGIPIARAVKLIADKTADKTLHTMLLEVAEDVEAGRTLSSSFEAHGGRLLPPTFVETLRAGEEAGNLANSFDSIYHHFDKQTKMAGKVRSAMAYPAFVLVIAVCVVIVLMVKVVPTFTSIFANQGRELPFMTQLLINISNFVRSTFVYFLLIVAILFVTYKLYGRTESGRMLFAKLQLKLPVLGNIAELNAASLFANTMATMVGSGIPMTKSVSITASVMENYLIQQKVNGMVARIEEGRTVVDSMRESGVMPDILTDMVGVGEETGEMKSTLDTVALYYDTELEMAIAKAIAMLEPATLVFLAGIAGFIVIAIYMSMFSMYQGM